MLKLAGLNAQALLYLERGELRTSFERSDRFLRLLGDRSLPFFQLDGSAPWRPAPTSTGTSTRAEELATAMTVPLP